MYSESRKFGNKGEEIACKFLESNRFSIIDRNYLRKIGEIDIVAKKDETIHFIEVKSVSREKDEVGKAADEFRPEDNISPSKISSLRRVIEIYLQDKGILERSWCFSVITVKIDESNKVARVKFIEDIVL